ncbi:MAG: phenylacetate-CoA oxygenase subunit PaaI, partial [Alphaproteobacteria bacterium]|nr:phenylacetate-CoA oxygenase subunit PaaI [Alphaproteobacteria bacterium]
EVATIAAFKAESDDYRRAVAKIVRSHAINELEGARIYDEPAIGQAPDPRAKWYACRIAAEEYHHHLRFKERGEAIGMAAGELMPGGAKRHMSLFDYPTPSWPEFCAIKMLGDLGEILQVEDLLACSFLPLRDLARDTMPEEQFHARFGENFCGDLAATDEGRAAVQGAVDWLFPMMPDFFGASNSANNETYRRFGIKARTNDEMRADYVARARDIVEGRLGLSLPDITLAPATP